MSRSHQEFVLDSDSDMRLLHGLEFHSFRLREIDDCLHGWVQSSCRTLKRASAFNIPQ